MKHLKGPPIGLALALPSNSKTQLERVTKGKQSSLLGLVVSDEGKKFYNIDARIIFEKATHVAFMKVDDLAAVWCEWAEMELRHENHEEALNLLRRATAPPPRRISYHDQGETVQAR
jgi:hypothetical protein